MKWQLGCYLACASVLMADGCGGGSESSTSSGSSGGSASAAGIYSGTSLVKLDVVESLALVTEQGDVTFFYGDGAHVDRGYVLHAGSIVGSGSLPARLTGYMPSGPSRLTRGPNDVSYAFPVQIAAVSTGSGMSVNWLGRTAEMGTDTQSTLRYRSALYNRTASLSKVAGVYMFNNGPYTVTISINSNGQLTGSDVDGCVVNGTVMVPQSNHNDYHVTANVDSCPSSGAYAGEALLDDSSNGGQDNVLLLAIRSSSNYAIAMPFSR